MAVFFAAIGLASEPPVQKTVTCRDGLKLACEVSGLGEMALVFLHGWSCDRSFWREQTAEFAAKYRIVSVDLAGHGQSGKKREQWSILELGKDIANLVNTLTGGDVVLIGHSMGGPVALAAAAHLQGKVKAVIGVDTLHNTEFQIPPAMIQGLVTSLEKDFDGTMAGFVSASMPPGADAALLDWIIKKAQAADHRVAIALVRDFPNLDLKRMLADAKVPVRCINAAPSPRGGMATATEVNQKYGDFDAVIMEGVGHFLMLEQPDAFNQRLNTLLAALTAK